MEEIARQAGWAKTFGLPLELISADEAQALFPPMSTDGVLGAAFLPTDGYVDPSQLTFALAEGARRRGAEIATGTRVTGHPRPQGPRRGGRDRPRRDRDGDRRQRRRHVRTRDRRARRRQRPDRADGARVPRHAAGRAAARDADDARPLAARLLPAGVGWARSWAATSGTCAPWSLDGIPADFNSKLLEEDWPRFEELMENAIVRVPSLEEMEVVRLINGPEAFTPDGEFILGPSDVRGFWVAAGFCAHGLAGAGGMGQLVAEWIVEGTPSLDVWHMDSRRFGAALPLAARTRSPARGRSTRPTTTSSTRATSGAPAGRSASRRRTSGCESSALRSARSPAGSGRTGSSRMPRDGDESLRPRGWAGKLWSPAIGAEHRACREAAALFDETLVREDRRRAARAPPSSSSGCATTASPASVGRITYTQMLNPRGGIECDFTVSRLGGGPVPDRDGHRVRPARPRLDRAARARGRLGARRGRHVDCRRATGSGGRARGRSSQPLTSADLGERALPVHERAAELDVGPVAVPRAARHVRRRARLGALLPDRVRPRALGHALGGRPRRTGSWPGGYKAIDSLRLEKGYRVWGADITPEETPYEAGLGFAVKLDKGDFVGRDALAGAGEPERLLRCLTLADPRAVALGSEPVRVDGELAGRVTSGGYGYTVERSIAYAYLPSRARRRDGGRRSRSSASGSTPRWPTEPLFDPAGERIRA